MGSSAMKSRMTLASSPGWLKLIAWAAPSMTTNAAKASYWLAISLIRAGVGIRGSRSPTTTKVGTSSWSSRSSAGN